MSPMPSTMRLFQIAVHAWVLGFIASGLPVAEWLWLHPVSPEWVPPGRLRYLTHLFAMGLREEWIALGLVVILVLSVVELIYAWRGRTGWILGRALIWFLYVNLMNRAWMAGSGGQQLMANVLFWNILLALPLGEGVKGNARVLSGALWSAGFWIIRLQLLLAYLATGLSKLGGTHWLDGTAMGIVATDPNYGPLWIAGHPLLAALATWAVLLFQFTFPVAVWWRRTRGPWMVLGVIFHVSTAIWLGIPEMGLAFLACYPIWMEDRSARRFLGPVIDAPRRVLAGAQ